MFVLTDIAIYKESRKIFHVLHGEVMKRHITFAPMIAEEKRKLKLTLITRESSKAEQDMKTMVVYMDISIISTIEKPICITLDKLSICHSSVGKSMLKVV